MKKPTQTVVKVSVVRKSIKPPTFKQRVQKCLETLKQKFPVLVENHPLVIGINKELFAHHPGTHREVNTALHFHTQSKPYLAALSRGEPRRDLHNQIVVESDEVSRAKAAQRIDARKKPAPKKRWKASLVRKVRTDKPMVSNFDTVEK